jgi:hypothetical protein
MKLLDKNGLKKKKNYEVHINISVCGFAIVINRTM